MLPPIPDSPEFSRLVAGDDRADLIRIALEVSRDADPDLDIESYLSRVDEFARRIGPRIPATGSTDDLLHQMNWVLYVEEGFSGNEDDYFDPRNSYLNEVIDRRLGIPISLGILYRGIAERLGLAMSGVNLPAHFVLRADRDDGTTAFVDPFNGGNVLDLEGCRLLIRSRVGPQIELNDDQFLPMSTAEVVARMLRNLRAIYLQIGDFREALPVLLRLSALEPGEATHRRDLGLVALGLDRLPEAIAQLSAYLEQADQAPDAESVMGLILDARRGLAEGS